MRVSVFSGILLVFSASAALGSRFNMNPWILIFEPDNKVISQMVTYTYQGENAAQNPQAQGPAANDAENAPVPVEVSIVGREVNLDGKVIYPNSQGADNFVVYPSQFILYPGDSKKIQVQWVGAGSPPKEVAFGFISTQIPLELDKNRPRPKSVVGKISIASRYEGIIVVRPRGAKPLVVVDSAYSVKDTAGTSLVFLLNNKGNGVQQIKNLGVTVTPLDAGGKILFAQRIKLKEVKAEVVTNQSLFPGFRRKIVLPWPEGLPVGPVNVTAEFTDGRK
jgi:fimbrial chaperone protein